MATNDEARWPRECSVSDPWRMDEWHALPDECFIKGCDEDRADQRGPVFLTDGSIHKACTSHWEAIFGVLGVQVSWQPDAHVMRHEDTR